MKTAADVLKLIKEKEVKFVDLRFTDTKGKEQHVTVPTRMVDDAFFEDGKGFDGSSIAGWKGIQESDMILMPDPATAVIDPFYEETTLNLRCDVIEPSNMQGYERDPRSLAKRARPISSPPASPTARCSARRTSSSSSTACATATRCNGAFYEVDSVQGAWNSGSSLDGGNIGHRPGVKGGYFPVPPVDAYQDLRTAMCLAMEELGLKVEVHHHEVATAGQGEINVAASTLTKKADEVQILKYAIHNVAASYGKTATFMPKPLVGDNGNGMHVNQSLTKDGKNIFGGDKYGGLSEIALYYIGGIIKHAKALNAICNASTNSYKRLVPGFEAPVMLAYSARNRSASIRIPHVMNPKARRIEVRFPDSTANPYLCFAGDGDGGTRRHPEQDPSGRPGGQGPVRPRARGGEEHPDGLSLARHGARRAGRDRGFLKEGGVFTDDVIDAYIGLKMQEVTRLRMTTHPVEFELYYSV